ncbi:uncharacterized protein LOC141656330 [Silene latifolia]|uniref:uncharacterized protein LOC141656330 n=1 Tax=Silene latifolia TaxID=37657 RepID=UPI003D77050F
MKESNKNDGLKRPSVKLSTRELFICIDSYTKPLLSESQLYQPTKMQKLKPMSQFRVSSCIRNEKDPIAAFNLFLNPNQTPNSTLKPFKHSLLSYDLIIDKLGRAKLFHELELILSKLKLETRISPTEIMFCNVITWYARGRLIDKALQVFDEMPMYRCPKTVKSLNTLLNGLLICREYDKMERIFLGFGRFGWRDACTYNVMINSCRARGDLVGARRLFDEMLERRFRPNVATFATLIAALCEGLKLKEALKLWNDMSRGYKIEPNVFVYTSLIKGLCDANELTEAFRLKDEMLEKNMKITSPIFTTLIRGLFKVGRKDDVQGVLDEMTKIGCKPDTATYNALITGYCEEGRIELGLGVLNEMKDKGCKPDVVSYNVIIRAYLNDGKFREAMDLFEDMPRRGCKPDVVSYRVLVQGLVDGTMLQEVVSYLDEMVFKGFAPYPVVINKFMTRLHQEGNSELLFQVLTSLAKGNYIYTDSWTLVTSIVCENSELSSFRQLFDSLIGDNCQVGLTAEQFCLNSNQTGEV